MSNLKSPMFTVEHVKCGKSELRWSLTEKKKTEFKVIISKITYLMNIYEC